MTIDTSHLLMCRTDNLGDVVLTLPVAGYLKRRYPAIRISFLCRGYAAPLVRHCKAVDQVIELEKMNNPASDLAAAAVDTILFFKPHRGLAAAAKKAGIANRVGTSHRLFHWLYCNRLAHFSRVISSLHEAQLNFALLRPLEIDHIPGLDEIPSFYEFDMPASDAMRARLPSNQFNLILHPKSNGNGREWPMTHYTALARLLAERSDVALWITGSKQEQEWLETNAAELLRMPNVTSVCGELTLEELASFINTADGLVASGTGPLHISAALGKPTLGLFPPLRPIHPGRWAPLGENAQVLCQSNPCDACKNPATCPCMLNITPEQVAENVLCWKKF
jgi:ADP-heptose:LPS heptosyltransferase